MLVAVKGYSQQSIQISGTLDDSLTHEPIRFATVSLINQPTNDPVKITQTDSGGHFVLENVPGGVFSLRATYIGYNDFFKENILINPATGDVNFGTLTMTTSKSEIDRKSVV